MESQAVGLAEAIGGEVRVLRVAARAPWRWLPGDLWPFPLAAAAGPDVLAPPWPDLVVTCGRHAAPLGAAIRRLAGGATRAVHVQNPRMSLAAFDAVVAPEHDRISGPNVLTHRLALHRITAASLAAAREAWAPRFAALKRPLVAVLVGAPGDGDRRHAEALAEGLAALAAGLVVTPSRRTPPCATGCPAPGCGTARERTPIAACWPARTPSSPPRIPSPWCRRRWPPACRCSRRGSGCARGGFRPS
jgi:mitochondrial fission protein ELM1